MTTQKPFATITANLIPTIYSQAHMVATCEIDDMFETCVCELNDIKDTFKKHHIHAIMCIFKSNEIYLGETPTPDGFNRYYELPVIYHCVVFKKRSDAVKFRMVCDDETWALNKIYVIKRGDTYLSVKNRMSTIVDDGEDSDIDDDFPAPVPVCVEWVRDINKAYRSYTTNSILPRLVGAEYVAFNCTNGDLHTPVG
ncbi:hypothetical protein [Paramagnetospirillum magneticum]|uniref:hypothetical protein n=1 Tax=Paramagnetospirillum magneticum TaxID=84159 RepID=UPI0011D087ED|nr:hypothetical protein [Paramagnetospirillum magneticum]